MRPREDTLPVAKTIESKLNETINTKGRNTTSPQSLSWTEAKAGPGKGGGAKK